MANKNPRVGYSRGMGFLYRDFTAAITIKSTKFLSVVIQVSVFSFGWFREWLVSARAFCRMETRSQNGREESQTDASIVRNDFFFLGGVYYRILK